MIMEYKGLTQFFRIKIFWVFVTWLKVEPSNHDSELKEMSELFIWDVGIVVVRRRECWPLLRVDVKSWLPVLQLCDMGQ